MFGEIKQVQYLYPDSIRRIALHIFDIYTYTARKFNCGEEASDEYELSQKIIVSAISIQHLEEWFKNYSKEYLTRLNNNLDKRYSQVIKDSILYIRNNVHRDLSLAEVAGKIGVGQTYLSSLFKKETGKNFVFYVTELKINLAKEMLCGDMLIYEIADKLGFENGNYFSKVFKKYSGVTAEQYRMKFRKLPLVEKNTHKA